MSVWCLRLWTVYRSHGKDRSQLRCSNHTPPSCPCPIHNPVQPIPAWPRLPPVARRPGQPSRRCVCPSLAPVDGCAVSRAMGAPNCSFVEGHRLDPSFWLLGIKLLRTSPHRVFCEHSLGFSGMLVSVTATCFLLQDAAKLFSGVPPYVTFPVFPSPCSVSAKLMDVPWSHLHRPDDR